MESENSQESTATAAEQVRAARTSFVGSLAALFNIRAGFWGFIQNIVSAIAACSAWQLAQKRCEHAEKQARGGGQVIPQGAPPRTALEGITGPSQP
jgi:hypothetical protein